MRGTYPSRTRVARASYVPPAALTVAQVALDWFEPSRGLCGVRSPVCLRFCCRSCVALASEGVHGPLQQLSRVLRLVEKTSGFGAPRRRGAGWRA